MSAYFMHNDPSIYPNPLEFIPDRWLGDIDPAMNQNLVPFTRGSRNCIGSNLALSEINLALAVLFRPAAPRMRLHETDESDVLQVHDFVNPLPRLDSLGVRVVVE
ncbi:MAG: hypothetical protein L6R37_006270 [Teloschistes peruensis]|nr:MAG: hypothetical protein L6R37_006270 [Teloschistes peruensis]